MPDKDVSEAARAMGRKGGAARAEALTPEERKAIAKAAAAERWKDKPAKKKAERPA